MTQESSNRFGGLWQDARFAVRVLWRDKSFSATVLATLAICIAANAIVFSVVHGVVLRPLSMPEAGRVVYFYNSYPKANAARASTGVPDYFDRLAAMPAVEAFALYRRQNATVATSQAQRVVALRTTPSLVGLSGAQPAFGRLLTDADGEQGRHLVAVLSDGLWRREFGAELGVVGRTVRINGEPHEIVGVLPAGFTFIWNDIDLWLPAAFTADEKSDDSRHSNNWQMIGRLAPGATVAQAQAQLDAVNARNRERFPSFRQVLDDAGFHSVVTGFAGELTRDVREMLYMLWGGALLVLLLGCVNVVNLAIVRATRRARELAIRHALGAGTGRLRIQLVMESVVLALTGGVAGLLLADLGLGAAGSTLALDDLPRGYEVGVSQVTWAVVLGASLLIGVVLGLFSAMPLANKGSSTALRSDGRSGTASRRALAIRRALATSQIALAFVLLLGAGLLFATFRAVLRLDPGFDPAGVMTATISLPATAYADDAALRAFADRLETSLGAIPGVTDVGITDLLPMTGSTNDSVIVPEGQVRQPGESVISPFVARVSDDYFAAMGIPIISGRAFDARDREGSMLAVIVDERLAERFWPGQDPLGRRIIQPSTAEDLVTPGPNALRVTVVGVVKNVRIDGYGPEARTEGAYYYSNRQSPSRTLRLVARTTGDPTTLVAPMRAAVRSLDAELPLFGVETMAGWMDDALATRRVPVFLSGSFGGVAIFLAALGIYGVLAYAVAERRREIGIRMALGSTQGAIFRHVLGDGARMLAAGLAVGAVGAYFATGAMASLLFGVAALDAGVIAGVTALLSGVALAAMYLPARRATKVEPTVALQ